MEGTTIAFTEIYFAKKLNFSDISNTHKNNPNVQSTNARIQYKNNRLQNL